MPSLTARTGGAIVVLIAMWLIAASGASACVALASLELADATARPGQEVSFRGAYYNNVNPVVVRWGAMDGPVVATVAPGDLVDFGHSFWREIGGRFTVPPDAEPGRYVVLATQQDGYEKPTWGVPARAALEIVDPDKPADRPLPRRGSPVARLDRLGRLETRQKTGNMATTLLVAVGTAVLGAVAVARIGHRR